MLKKIDVRHCPICEATAIINEETDSLVFVDCPACGKFKIDLEKISDFQRHSLEADKFASYLYYNGKINPLAKNEPTTFFNYIGEKDEFEEIYASNHNCRFVSQDIVNNWHPRTFSEKVDTFLLGLYRKQNYLGEEIELPDTQFRSAAFVKRHSVSIIAGEVISDTSQRQISFFRNYLIKEAGYIKNCGNRYIITALGIKRIDELQRDEESISKNVFIAMNFDKKMKSVREAIENAVKKCGYIPRIMDEVEHNNQIVPEMLYEIRKSKFVIAELTGHRNGVYFEAGYALGHNKNVIQACCKCSFEEDAHFDVKQINTILWDEPCELEEKLVARIEATIA